MTKYLTAICCALLLSGCYADELSKEMQADPFFDLTGYIDAQTDSLTQASVSVTKSIVLNGTSETKKIADLNFKNDLRVFRAADINRPAWLDKYTVSTAENGGELITTYAAIDPDLQTRSLAVTRVEGKITVIEIVRNTGTVLSDGVQKMEYRPASGYRMTTDQENKFGKDVAAEIEVKW